MPKYFYENPALAVIAIVFQLVSYGQTPAKPEHVREFLELTGSAKVGVQMMNIVIDFYRKNLPEVSAEFWDEFLKEVKTNDLLEIVIPIYAKNFTDEEISRLITFYKSPIGKKVVETLPAITQESYKIGETWGKSLGEKVISRLKSKGYLLDN